MSSRASSRPTSTPRPRPSMRSSPPACGAGARGPVTGRRRDDRLPDTAALGEADLLRRPGYAPRQGDRDVRPGGDGDGTVLAVGQAGRREVAEANVGPQVQAGYRSSTAPARSIRRPGVVEDGTISFPVVTARQVLESTRPPSRPRSGAKPTRGSQGHPRPVRSIQAVVWPDWVGTIPTLDARVEVRTTEVAEP